MDIGALFPGSPLAIDATDLCFSSCGVRSQARYSTAYDVDGVRSYDFGMFRIEAGLAGKSARHLFDSDVIGVTSPGNFDASIEDALEPVAKSARGVG